MSRALRRLPRQALRLLLCGALAAGALGAACGHARREPPAPTPSPTLDWPAVLGDARRAVEAGRYADADRVLAGFAEQYQGSPESNEVLYWRAVLQLDPANKDGSTQQATQTLDAYLALPSGQHRVEAELLRRLAGLIASLAADVQAAKAAPPVTAAPRPDTTGLRERDEEIARLRDSLTKTSAELERVRRRLAPRP